MLFEDTQSTIIDDVYRAMREEFLSGSPLVNGIMGHVLAARGKGMRPLFMYRVARLSGGTWEPLRRAAMVVEAIHVASLLHDDVVDGSKLRRGVATLNSRHSDKVSVLFGDFVFLRSLTLSQTLGNPEIVTVIQRAAERMVQGEIVESLSPELVDEERYLAIIADKTAALFAAAGEIGVILTGGDEDERKRARELGECVGMAFQIIDDALDFRGEAGVMGKPTLVDIRTGCQTLPIIHALREYDPETAAGMLADGSRSPERLLAVVRENGGIEYAIGRAEEFMRRGKELLRLWEGSDCRDSFDRFFDTLLDRRY